jgi:DNA-nicking Smr family endonuclease
MKFKIGEKVRFLNETGEGIVVKIIDNKTILVNDETGFDRPFLAKDIIKIDKTESILLDKETNEEFEEQTENTSDTLTDKEIDEILSKDKTKFKTNNETDIKIYFAITKKESKYNFYIINYSSFNCFINLINLSENKSFYNGLIESNTKIKISEKDFFNDDIKILSQIIFIKDNYDNIHSPAETEFNIKSVKLTKESTFKENDFFNQKALLIELFSYDLSDEIEKIDEKEFKKILKQKQEAENLQKKLGSKYKAKQRKILVEVDLHIHNLVDNYKNLSNSEMLDIQINEFHNQLNKAIKEKAEKIVFIHGVGKGVLKNKIRDILKKDYKKYKFQDASFKDYGAGATLVFL